ncbi:hypothetical protein KAW18_01905 [candidate division WOR-3 bacterium]|nr:hypothetical protein [candidate division WOR-3 bacterium]
MAKIEVVSRSGRVLGIIERTIQTGTKGKLKNKKFVMYKDKRQIVEKDRFGIFSIFPWGIYSIEKGLSRR